MNYVLLLLILMYEMLLDYSVMIGVKIVENDGVLERIGLLVKRIIDDE